MQEREPEPSARQAGNHRRVKRWLAWTVGALAAVALLLTALTLVAVQTQWGTRLLWQTVTVFVPGQLSGELVGGTLGKGVGLRNIVYQDETQRIRINRLDAEWRLQRSPLWLVVHYLHVGTAEVTLLPTPSTPLTLPARLALPLPIEVQEASLQQLDIHQGGATDAMGFSNIRLQAAYDGVKHVLTLKQAETPVGLATGTLQIHGMAPYDVAGAVGLSSQYGNTTYQLNTRLSGTLEALNLQLDVAGDKLQGRANIDATPFAAVPVRRAEITVRGLNPRVFNPQWPQAKLDIYAALTPSGDASGDLSKLTVTGPVALTNALPGPTDRGLLPLESASMDISLNQHTQQLSQLKLRLPGKATVVGSGEVHSGGKGLLTLRAQGLNLQSLHTQLKASQLSGPIAMQMTGDTQKLDLKLAGPALSVNAQATLEPQKVVLHTAEIRSGAAQLALTGNLARDAQAAYSVSGALSDFNPALFFASAPRSTVRNARINADFNVSGALQPALSSNIRFNVHDSQYDGMPMTGGGTIQLVGKQLRTSEAQLSIAGNSAQLKGSFGSPSDRLALDIRAPALQRLGFGLAGMLEVRGAVAGTLERPTLDVQYRADNLAFGSHRLAALSGEARTQGVPGQAPNARVLVTLDARGLQSGDLELSKLSASIDGTYGEHAARLNADGRLRNQPLQLVLAATGRLREQPQGMAWDGVVCTLENRTSPQIQLESPLQLSVAAGRVTLGAARLTVAKSSINLQNLVYSDALLRTEGNVQALEVGQVLALWQQFSGQAPAFTTDLVLDGKWNVTLADGAEGFVDISRRSGDVRLAGHSALGLGALSVNAKLHNSHIAFDTKLSATRMGTVSGTGQIGLLLEDKKLTLAPRSPVTGRVNATLPNLQTIASLAGPSIALEGSANMALTVNGTLGQPLLSGTVEGDRLALTLYDQGVRLRDGIARLRLENNIVELQQLQFQGGDGTLRATGRVALDSTAPGLTATIVANKLQLLASPSAQLTVSGEAVASNAGGQLLVKGKFDVDQGLFSLPETTAPQLDSDVVVVRRGQAQPAPRLNAAASERPANAFTPRIDIELGLGNNLSFNGAGAKMRLAGALSLRSEPGATPQAFGSVQVVDGSYDAFGTNLAIESGVINFQGSLRNPNLNILAMRRQQEVAAGVRVTGTVRNPRVQVVSEPDLPQEQALSWLVFGRGDGGGESGQAQSAVQGAALGLLNKFGAKRAAQSFGLDTLAIGDSKFGLAGGQVVNLGKEISDRLYIGYEQSLAGAESVLKLIYALTPNWSVELRGGTVASVDVLYNKRFDRLRGKLQ